jgi:hypothetical protein
MRSRDVVPRMTELVSYMWAPRVAFSYARTGTDMHDSTDVAIKWDKWLDNPDWRGQPKGTEHISFEWNCFDRVRSEVSEEFCRLCRASRAESVLTIEMADDAVAMDRRAFVRAVYVIAERAQGCIYSPDDQRVLDASEYYRANRELIEKAFSADVNAE